MEENLSAEDQVMADARQIFAAAIEAVSPIQMIGNKLQYDKKTSVLTIPNGQFQLNKNVSVVGFGKAVLGMARAVEDCIGEHIVRGVISVPQGCKEVFKKAGKEHMLLSEGSKLQVLEGAANNLPDEDAHTAALAIQRVVEQAQKGDVLIVLISGGGSALLPSPAPPLTLADMLSVTRQLSRAGATILELNSVRKELEVMKGGGLARLAQPANTVAFILSDIINDPLDFIASGPTVYSDTTPQECLTILHKYIPEASIPESVTGLLNKRVSEVKAGIKDIDWSKVHNVLVGSNKIACKEAFAKSKSLGYCPHILCTDLDGEAKLVGRMFAVMGQYLFAFFSGVKKVNLDTLYADLKSNWRVYEDKLGEICNLAEKVKADDTYRGICILAGGETTVQVTGDGKGGRNQEMALSAAIEFSRLIPGLEQPVGEIGMAFLSGGTDGQDGPTIAAGGVVSPLFKPSVELLGLNCEDFLSRNDSFSLLSQVSRGKHLVVTGLTGTNVMDVQILLVKKP